MFAGEAGPVGAEGDRVPQQVGLRVPSTHGLTEKGQAQAVVPDV